MRDELYYTMALTKVPGVGPDGARRLIAAFGRAEDVFQGSKKELSALAGIGDKTVENIHNFSGFDRVESELEFIDNHGIQALPFHHPDFPSRLRDITDTPALIFYKGSVPLNQARVIGVVGTRKASDYGMSLVNELMQDLAPYQVITVSGLAYGVDIACHRKSLEYGIPTIGVLAHGLDMVYPSAHTHVARKMIKNGGLLSEHTSGVALRREYFPRRNRLVAGLVDALVVVETPAKGGSLITAEIAFSYNREVLAFPGRAKDDKSEGCNGLIKKGKAQLIENASDLAYALGWPDPGRQSSQNEKLSQLNGVEKRIYEYLRTSNHQKANLETISADLDIGHSELSLILLNMEFGGYVRNLPGNFYKAE